MNEDTPNVGNLNTESLLSSPLGIIVCILLAIIVLFIVYILIKKISYTRKLNQERKSLKDDLMIWSSLKNLVSGGKKTNKGKQDLSPNIISIQTIFKSVKNFVKQHCRKGKRSPWFVLIGEPLSGKSELLRSSQLDFARHRDDIDVKDNEALHFNVNRDSVVLDVKGKIFFDHWLGGSSSEWQYICQQIKRYHYETPLSGIVVTIPADALIIDDEALATKKASLIFSELTYLLEELSMNLPCHVVITKCDCIKGFKEYFENTTDTEKSKFFGIQSLDFASGYSELNFKDKWQSFIENLENVALKSMYLAKDVDFKNRSNRNTYIYTFSKAVNDLYENLNIYLKEIFKASDLDETLRLEGVFFTSSQTMGVCFDKSYANFVNKKVEDARIVSNGEVKRDPYFIRGLLSDFILKLSSKPSFTKKELRRRNTPFVIFASCLIAISLYSIAGIVLGNSLIKEKYSADITVYKNFKEMFSRNIPQNSPLLDVDEKGSGILLFDKKMSAGTSDSRYNYFGSSKEALLKSIPLSFLYSPQSYLLFTGNNLFKNKRDTLYNQLLIDMVYQSAIASFANNLLVDDSPFTIQKADAFIDYLELAISNQNSSKQSSINLISSSLKTILNYLYPHITEDTLNQLNLVKDADDNYPKASLNKILFSNEYTSSVQAGMKKLLKQIKNVTVYPDSAYQVSKNALKITLKMNEILSELEKVDYTYDNHDAPDRNVKEYEHILSLLNDYIQNANKLAQEGIFFVNSYANASKAVKSDKEKDSKKGLDKESLAHNALVESAYQDYKRSLIADINELVKFSQERENSGLSLDNYLSAFGAFEKNKNDALNNLQIDYAEVKEILTRVEKSALLKQIELTQKNNSVTRYTYQIFKDLFEIVNISEKDISTEIISPADFLSAYNKIITEYYDCYKKIENLFKTYDGLTELHSFEDALKSILKYGQFSYKVRLVNNFLDLYPHSKSFTQNLSDFNVIAAKLDDNFKYEKSFSPEAVQEVLGNFILPPEYNPDIVSNYLNPIASLMNIKNDIQKQQMNAVIDNQNMRTSTSYIANSKRFSDVYEVVSTYAEGFVNFWANLPDAISPLASDYYSFHKFAQNSRAYEINAKLLDMYNFSYEVLSSIDDAILKPKTLSAKKEALKSIDNRRKSLSLEFTTVCNNVLNSWALLPEDAVKANRYISALDKKTVRNDFTIVRNLNSAKSNIPWWTSFVNLGTALLKSEATSEASINLNNFQSRLYYFPILKDAMKGTLAITVEDMPQLNRSLKAFGIKIPKDKEQNSDDPNLMKEELSSDEGVDNLQYSIFDNLAPEKSDISEWAYKVSKILTDLSDTQEPLEVKISLPNFEAQQKLIKKYANEFNSAATTLRYVEAGVDGVKYQRVGTITATDENVIYDGDMNIRNLTLDFFRFSDSDKPEVHYQISGSYASLRLYLAKNGIYDQKSNIVHVPVYLDDQTGKNGVIFIDVKFNKKLISPKDWPSSENWPSINDF